MAERFVTSLSSFTLKSSWSYNQKIWDTDLGQYYYYKPTTPSTASKTVSVSLSSIPAGSRVISASLQIRTSNSSSTATIGGKTFNVNNDHTSGINIASGISSLGSSLSITFKFQYSGGPPVPSSSSSGSRSSYFSEIKLIIDYELPSSDGTMDVTEIEAGPDSTITLTISPSNPNYNHVVTWTFGSLTEVDTLAVGETVADLDVPLSFLNQIPNATSGEGTVTIDTYDGTELKGSKSYTFTVTVPDSVVPTAGTFSATPITQNVHQDLASTFIQGYSSANLSLSNVSGVYGSTITSVLFGGWGDAATGTASGSTYTASTPVLSTSGTVALQALITDSRGRTSTKTLNITVAEYTRPTIVAMTAKRCNNDANMTINDQGTSAKVTVTYTVASINNLNSVTTASYYKLSSDVAYTNANRTFTSNTPFKIIGPLSADGTYNIKATITDKAGNTATAVITIPTATYVLHFRDGGTSVGVGRAASPNDNTFAINDSWDAFIGGTNIAKYPKRLAVVADISDSPYNNNANNCLVAGTYIVSSVANTVSNLPVQKIGQLTVGSAIADEHNIAIATTATCTMYQMFVAGDLSDIYFRTMSTTGTAGSVTFGQWVRSNFSGTVSVDHGGTGQTTIEGIRTALNVSQDIKPGDVIDISGYKSGGWVTSSRSQFRTAICLGRRITATAVAISGTGWIIGPGGKIVGGDNAANVTSMGTFSYTIKADAGFIAIIFSKSFSTTNNTPHTLEIATGSLTFS